MFRRLLLVVLGIALMLVASACGQTASTGGATGSTATAGSTTADDAMPMDTTSTAMAMDHSETATGSAPFDAQFIDGMIEHHTGAITMAEQALEESERPEIQGLAQDIITSQQGEVEQMTAWRRQWYPDLAPTGGMEMPMGDMEISSDTSQPFDQRFIAAMIGHHTGAISMANDALTNAEHPEIKQLAEAIITAQEAEIAQMQQWNTEWFGG